MTLFLYDSVILDSSIPFLGLIHCECLLVKDYFLIVVLDGIRYRYWVIYDDRYKVADDYEYINCFGTSVIRIFDRPL